MPVAIEDTTAWGKQVAAKLLGCHISPEQALIPVGNPTGVRRYTILALSDYAEREGRLAEYLLELGYDGSFVLRDAFGPQQPDFPQYAELVDFIYVYGCPLLPDSLSWAYNRFYRILREMWNRNGIWSYQDHFSPDYGLDEFSRELRHALVQHCPL